ncbi:MAG: putative toxin-antitoxin system toxin component, PIN family [Bacteroidales bacterium]|nr:putative toxin-antitoxin system toxin component, PIN family [Bacteroidales bacterium]
MKVLFDTNLWISFMIGKRLSSLANVLNRQDVEVYVSEQLLDEIRTVISRPKFDTLISKETRYYFFEMVYDVCQITDITVQAESPIRDIKDLYLLSMAESVPVDFIVSGDKDLTDLGSHADIPILSYTNFVTMLSTIEKDNN